MLIKIKSFKLIVCLLCLGFITIITSVTVDAARVNIVKDPNVEGVQILSLDNENYYVEIDEETGYGYIIWDNGFESKILGTCIIYLINENNDQISLCIEDNNFSYFGIMSIKLTDEINNKGYIDYVNGKLSSIVDFGSEVIIN